jgi:hypothetical protein
MSAVLLLLFLQAAWSLEPNAFRGVPFGATKQEANAILSSFNCVDRSHDGHTIVCTSYFFLGNASITSTLVFLDNKFVAVDGLFDNKDYSTVRTAFTEKYGSPMTVRHSVLGNAFGGTFDQEQLAWNGRRIYIELQRYLPINSSPGAFKISTQTYLKALKKETTEQNKKLKDAL